jgi:hypothetical protein
VNQKIKNNLWKPIWFKTKEGTLRSENVELKIKRNNTTTIGVKNHVNTTNYLKSVSSTYSKKFKTK